MCLNGYHLKVTKKQGIALMLNVTTNDDTQDEMKKVAAFLEKHSVKEEEACN